MKEMERVGREHDATRRSIKETERPNYDVYMNQRKETLGQGMPTIASTRPGAQEDHPAEGALVPAIPHPALRRKSEGIRIRIHAVDLFGKTTTVPRIEQLVRTIRDLATEATKIIFTKTVVTGRSDPLHQKAATCAAVSAYAAANLNAMNPDTWEHINMTQAVTKEWFRQCNREIARTLRRRREEHAGRMEERQKMLTHTLDALRKEQKGEQEQATEEHRKAQQIGKATYPKDKRIQIGHITNLVRTITATQGGHNVETAHLQDEKVSLLTALAQANTEHAEALHQAIGKRANMETGAQGGTGEEWKCQDEIRSHTDQIEAIKEIRVPLPSPFITKPLHNNDGDVYINEGELAIIQRYADTAALSDGKERKRDKQDETPTTCGMISIDELPRIIGEGLTRVTDGGTQQEPTRANIVRGCLHVNASDRRDSGTHYTCVAYEITNSEHQHPPLTLKEGGEHKEIEGDTREQTRGDKEPQGTAATPKTTHYEPAEKGATQNLIETDNQPKDSIPAKEPKGHAKTTRSNAATLVAVAMIRTRLGKAEILLEEELWNRNPNDEGRDGWTTWTLPGGRAEPYETDPQAGARALKNTVGIEAPTQPDAWNHVNDITVCEPHHRELCKACRSTEGAQTVRTYIVTRWGGTIPPGRRDAPQGQRTRWTRVEALQEEATAGLMGTSLQASWRIIQRQMRRLESTQGIRTQDDAHTATSNTPNPDTKWYHQGQTPDATEQRWKPWRPSRPGESHGKERDEAIKNRKKPQRYLFRKGKSHWVGRNSKEKKERREELRLKRRKERNECYQEAQRRQEDRTRSKRRKETNERHQEAQRRRNEQTKQQTDRDQMNPREARHTQRTKPPKHRKRKREEEETESKERNETKTKQQRKGKKERNKARAKAEGTRGPTRHLQKASEAPRGPNEGSPRPESPPGAPHAVAGPATSKSTKNTVAHAWPKRTYPTT